jgi:hypothetical protein
MELKWWIIMPGTWKGSRREVEVGRIRLFPTDRVHVGYHHAFTSVIAVVNGTFDAALLANATSRQNLCQFVLVNHAYAFSLAPNVPDIKLSMILAKDTRALASRACGVYLAKVMDAENGNGD